MAAGAGQQVRLAFRLREHVDDRRLFPRRVIGEDLVADDVRDGRDAEKRLDDDASCVAHRVRARVRSFAI